MPRREKPREGRVRTRTAGRVLLGALALSCGCASSARQQEARFRHVGGRVGCFVPLSEKDNSFEPAWILGGYYRTEPLTTTTLMYEVAVDFIASRSDTGEVESSLCVAALDLLWCPWSYWSSAGWEADFYVFGGGGVLVEASLTEMSEGRLSDTDWTGAINLGLGLASLQKGWDLRATYTLFPGSRNVVGALSITAGWAFSF